MLSNYCHVMQLGELSIILIKKKYWRTGIISTVADPKEKCPVTSESTTCHVGLKHTCNNDDECSNGTYCCFTGCRRQCWNPERRQSSIIGTWLSAKVKFHQVTMIKRVDKFMHLRPGSSAKYIPYCGRNARSVRVQSAYYDMLIYYT